MRPGRFQRWLELQSVYTGTWIIPIAVEKDIPRFLNVGSFQVKVWYKGQPVKCDICREDGHKATDCPAKGKCFNCKEAGHLAKECPRLVKHPETVVASTINYINVVIIVGSAVRHVPFASVVLMIFSVLFGFQPEEIISRDISYCASRAPLGFDSPGTSVGEITSLKQLDFTWRSSRHLGFRLHGKGYFCSRMNYHHNSTASFQLI